MIWMLTKLDRKQGQQDTVLGRGWVRWRRWWEQSWCRKGGGGAWGSAWGEWRSGIRAWGVHAPERPFSHCINKEITVRRGSVPLTSSATTHTRLNSCTHSHILIGIIHACTHTHTQDYKHTNKDKLMQTNVHSQTQHQLNKPTHTNNKKHHNIVAPPVSSSPINELPAPGMLQRGGN